MASSFNLRFCSSPSEQEIGVCSRIHSSADQSNHTGENHNQRKDTATRITNP